MTLSNHHQQQHLANARLPGAALTSVLGSADRQRIEDPPERN